MMPLALVEAAGVFCLVLKYSIYKSKAEREGK
jgi:hypothetical protein